MNQAHPAEFRSIPPEISILIVTYNSALVISDCLASIQDQREVRTETWVIDNASEDRTREIIEADFPWVHLIKNENNLGFGKANNLGLAQVTSPYVYFLNPDTQLTPSTLSLLLTYMATHPKVGLAGTTITYPLGTPQSSVSIVYPGQRQSRGEMENLPGSIACVQGSSMIMPTRLAVKIGGFDEDYFLYGEDQDLCLRVRQGGFEIGCVENALIHHSQGHSEKISGSEILWQRKIQAEYIFYRKHYSSPSIARIRRAHLIKSGWVLLTQFLLSPFVSKTSKRQEQLAKYRAIWKNAAHF